jgi:hypothetical protein
MGKPKALFYVQIRRGAGKRLRVYEKGGGLYSSRAYAQEQVDRLRAKGVECDLFTTGPVEWVEEAPVKVSQDSELPLDFS